MFGSMDRFHELENLRRSLAMAPPGSSGLDREEAMRILGELQGLDQRLRGLKDRIRALLEEDEPR